MMAWRGSGVRAGVGVGRGRRRWRSCMIFQGGLCSEDGKDFERVWVSFSLLGLFLSHLLFSCIRGFLSH